MKKAFSTVACQTLGYKEVADCTIAAGLHAIEVRLQKNGNKFFNLPVDEIPEALEYFEEKQIMITDLGTSVSIRDYKPETMDELKECVDLANMTKAKGIRVFLGPFIQRFSEVSAHNYEGIVQSLKEICLYAQTRNVEIWVETHNAFSTGKVLQKLIQDVGYDNLKIIWDIIHPYEFDEKPKETLQYLGDRIAHVHIKDGVKKEDPDLIIYKYTKLGEGDLPIAEIISLLENAGYKGFYSLEWENAWKKEIKDVFGSLPEILDHFNYFMDSKEDFT